MMEKYKLLSIFVLAAILIVPGNAIFAANINGTGDDDFLEGTPGKDRINGQGGDDHLRGFGGDDNLKGAGGQDRLEGDNGDDTLVGGAGADVLTGGLGNDDMNGGADDDWLLGNAGEDFLDGGSENDVLDGGDDDDNVKGGSGNDHAFGGKGNDLVTGGPGDDVVEGGIGNDTVFADDGEDTLSGGPGSDKLVGGLGPDTYFCGTTGEGELAGDTKHDNDTPGTGDDFFGDIVFWDGGPGTFWTLDTITIEGEDETPPADCDVTVEVDPRLGEVAPPPGGGGGEPGEPEPDAEFVSINDRIQAGVPSELKQGTANKLFESLAASESLFASNGDADTIACGSLDDFETLVGTFNDKKLNQTLRDDIITELLDLRFLKQC